jgi:hypothetical protein
LKPWNWFASNANVPMDSIGNRPGTPGKLDPRREEKFRNRFLAAF